MLQLSTQNDTSLAMENFSHVPNALKVFLSLFPLKYNVKMRSFRSCYFRKWNYRSKYSMFLIPSHLYNRDSANGENAPKYFCYFFLNNIHIVSVLEDMLPKIPYT